MDPALAQLIDVFGSGELTWRTLVGLVRAMQSATLIELVLSIGIGFYLLIDVVWLGG